MATQATTLWTKLKTSISVRDLLYFAAILLLTLQLFKQGQRTVAAETNAAAAAERVEHFKNREGQLVARISTLTDVRGLLTSQDSILRKLAASVDKSTTTATVFTTITKTVAAGKTDTVKLFKNNKPEYTATLRKPWATYWLRMNADSSFVTSETRNEFLVNTHRTRYGFLNLKSKVVTDVTSTNPDTGVDEMRSFAASKATPRFVVGPLVGIGIGPTLTPAPFVGIGVTYPLLSW